MVALALYFFAAFGLSFIVGHSKISLPFRQLLGGWVEHTAVPSVATGEVHGHIQHHRPMVPVLGPFFVALVECPGCLGWWVGAFTGLVAPEFVMIQAPGIDALTLSAFGCAVVLGCATAGVNMVLGHFVGMTDD